MPAKPRIIPTYVVILRNDPKFPDQICRNPDTQKFELSFHDAENLRGTLARRYPNNVYVVYKLEPV